MITICVTYFRSLTLANLDAALYSISRQSRKDVEKIVVVDNNTSDATQLVQATIDEQEFTIPTLLVSVKHGDDTRQHAWSTNFALRQTETPWIFYTRADYLLDFRILKKFRNVAMSKGSSWDGFIVGHGRHLGSDISACEQTPWREQGPGILDGVEYDYTEIDSGVWMMRRETFNRVGGLNEKLSAWGHSQTEFQHRAYLAGVEFVRIPEMLFVHPAHGGEKDMTLANDQLAGHGSATLKEMWRRYHGASPYA